MQSPVGHWVAPPTVAAPTPPLEDPDLDIATEELTGYTFETKPVYRRTFTGVSPASGGSAALTAAGYAESFALAHGGYLRAGGTRAFAWAHTMLNGVLERCWLEIDAAGAIQIFVNGTFYQTSPYKAIIYYTKP